MIRRFLPAFGKIFSITIVSVLITIGVLINTETGSRWMIRTMLLTVPRQLSIKQIDGTLADRIKLREIQYRQPNQFISIDTIQLAWQPGALLTGTLLVNELIARDIVLDLAESSSTSDSDGIDGAAFKNPLPLKVVVENLAIENTQLTHNGQFHQIQQINLAASLVENKVRCKSLLIKAQQLSLDANGEFLLAENLPFSLRFRWHADMTDQGIWVGSSTVSGDLKAMSFKNNLSSPFKLIQDGSLDLNHLQPRFSTSGDWNGLSWPFNKKAEQLTSKTGRFKIAGTLDDYQIEVSSQLQTKTISSADLVLNGKGDKQSLIINNFDLSTADGILHLAGTVSWARRLTFDLTANADKFNPGLFAPDFPGDINLQSHLTGRWLDQQLRTEIDLQSLNGQLRGYPIRAAGQFSISNNAATFDDLRVESGKNSIFINGNVDQSVADLDFSINAPDLEAVWPTLSGKLIGEGKVSGTARNPNIMLKAEGDNLGFDNIRAKHLSVNADFGMDPSKTSYAHLKATGIRSGDKRITAISVDARGTLAGHRGQVTLRSPYANVNTQVTGAVTSESWNGLISRLEVDAFDRGNWHLRKPAQITVAKKQSGYDISLERSCLLDRKASLCVSLNKQGDHRASLEVTAEALPLALAKDALPKSIEIAGTLSGSGWWRTESNDQTAAFEIKLDEGSALLLDRGDRQKTLNLDESNIMARFENNIWNSEFNVALPFGNGVRGNLQASLEKPRPITGKVIVTIQQLSLLDPFFPELSPLKGELNVDIVISGNLERPIAAGELRLQKGEADLQRLGLELRNISLHARAPQDRTGIIVIEGRAQSGKGTLSINGSVQPSDDGEWPLELHLSGTDVEAARLPEAQVFISPDLTFMSTNTSKKLTGKIVIPSATLTLEELPEKAIAPSEDEIIIGKRDPEQQTPKSLTSEIDTTVSIVLGESVTLSGRGLTTGLRGKLEITKTGEQTVAHGKIELKNAHYQAYGQDLEVGRGQILFNGPVDNPWLDVEATRLSNSKKITAKLSVTGPLQSPQTHVSSTPPLRETEALAYLLTGRPLNRASQSETNMIASAALSYGIGRLTWLTEKLGIDEFEIQEGETLEDTLVLVGKYITPDFYVGTNVGLFNRNPDLVLKHRLTDELSVETYSGESHQIELKYEFDVE